MTTDPAIQAFDFSLNLMRVILWQYNDATRLQSLIDHKNKWYLENYTEFWNNWHRDVFDLRTANDFGLAVWSIILGLTGVNIVEPTPDNKPNWGFSTYNENFDHGNFSNSSSSVPVYTTDERRIMLRLRYYKLTHRPTVPNINMILREVFGHLGTAVVQDNLDMTITYVFLFALPPKLSQALDDFDLLPRPTGVGVIRATTPRPNIFGFGVENENFEHGNFLD